MKRTIHDYTPDGLRERLRKLERQQADERRRGDPPPSYVEPTANESGSDSIVSASFLIGDGSTTSFPLVHGFGTRRVIVQVWDLSGGSSVLALSAPSSVEATNASTVTVNFASAPSANRYRVNMIALDPSGISMSGGVETEPGDGYRYHTFTSSGTLSVFAPGQVQYFVVGGGGGGGSRRAGGGGGAGAAISGFLTISADQAITVGLGGSGGAPSSDTSGPTAGSPSSIGSLVTAAGGGRGGHGTTVISSSGGGSGGNGGGGAGAGANGTTSGGAGVQFDGGTGRGDLSTAANRGGGGGGGAGSQGANGGVGTAGAGGSGVEWPTGSGNFYARGGDGATNATGAVSNGAVNTGDGGPGSNSSNGGNGGTGIVIIRYAV